MRNRNEVHIFSACLGYQSLDWAALGNNNGEGVEFGELWDFMHATLG